MRNQLKEQRKLERSRSKDLPKMKTFALKEGVNTLIDLCKDLEIESWLDMVEYLEENGHDTDNFTFEEWYVLWLVRQNQIIFKLHGHYLTELGFL